MFRTPVAVILIAVVTLFVACGPQKKGLFGDKRSEHQKYGDKIKEAGLDKTQLGSLWFFAANKSIAQPLNITLPYKESGYFAADKPAAAGYLFNARRGDRITISVTLTPANTSVFFAELWRHAPTVDESDLLAVADSTMNIIQDVEQDGQFLIRLQPELLQGIEYNVTVTAGPSLAFPVSEAGDPKLISFWDDPRDGGVRSHQGVDISARFRTPAIACADGRIHNVTENRLGGKVVFMRPKGKKYSLYYAHLDTQTVSSGDEVKAGHVLGLIGNTGNARNTPPHLHFGIYGMGGAVDPLPFIDMRRPETKEITAPLSAVSKWIRTASDAKVYLSPAANDSAFITLERGSAVNITGATGDWYKVRTPDDREGYLKSEATTDKILRSLTIDTLVRLLDQPAENAAAMKTVNKKAKLSVVGTFGDFYLIKHNGMQGWLNKGTADNRIAGEIQRSLQ